MWLALKMMVLVLVGLVGGCIDDDYDGPDQTVRMFSYSVLTSDSDSGSGLDLLEELNSSVLPELEKVGAQEYAIWSRVSEPLPFFQKLLKTNGLLCFDGERSCPDASRRNWKR